MNAPQPWHDPVVAEIHAVRQELVEQYRGDLVAFSEAAQEHCRALGLQFVASPRRQDSVADAGQTTIPVPASVHTA